jgi:hypothetical protein
MPSRSRTIFFAGLALYVISFFLLAVSFGDPSAFNPRPLHGWACADIALVEPWNSNGLSDLREAPFAWAALLLSGLINPVFLIAAALAWLQRARRAVLTLTIATLAMIPFCWVVFHYEKLHPREGHFLWILGMILVLFSGFSSRREDLPVVPAAS